MPPDRQAAPFLHHALALANENPPTPPASPLLSPSPYLRRLVLCAKAKAAPVDPPWIRSSPTLVIVVADKDFDCVNRPTYLTICHPPANPSCMSEPPPMPILTKANGESSWLAALRCSVQTLVSPITCAKPQRAGGEVQRRRPLASSTIPHGRLPWRQRTMTHVRSAQVCALLDAAASAMVRRRALRRTNELGEVASLGYPVSLCAMQRDTLHYRPSAAISHPRRWNRRAGITQSKVDRKNFWAGLRNVACRYLGRSVHRATYRMTQELFVAFLLRVATCVHAAWRNLRDASNHRPASKS